eukprot:m.945196 g.945196  ORF g.945196 m.945196 type:complete len:513 (+) comp23845_c0_seq6:233-1771(+)
MGVGDLRLFKRVAGKQRFNALQEKQYRAIKTRARVAGSVLALFGCLAFAGNEWDSGSIFSADGGNHIARRSTQNDTDPPFVSNYTCKSGHVTPVTEPQYSYGIGDCDCFEKRYKELFNYTNVTWTAGNWSAQSCDVKSIPEGMDPCVFVTCTADCQLQPDSGYINYLRLPYCQLKGKQNGASVVILVIWLLVLFVALGTTAEDFFCPSLSVISDTLGLSDNVAGVTFLALGNGAPDIFSVYAGIVNTKGTKGGSLAIGELFGAGVFVTTVVFGAVSFVAPFTVTRRPFLRDCVCYMTATIFLFYVMLKGEITIEESAGFLVIYVVYVLVVVFGRKIYQAKKKQLETDAQKRAAMHTPNDALGNDAADDRALLARISPVSDEYGGYGAFAGAREYVRCPAFGCSRGARVGAPWTLPTARVRRDGHPDVQLWSEAVAPRVRMTHTMLTPPTDWVCAPCCIWGDLMSPSARYPTPNAQHSPRRGGTDTRARGQNVASWSGGSVAVCRTLMLVPVL